MATPELPPDLPAGCWGKINHGQKWFPLTKDVGRALSVARLGDYERALIYAMQERSWGDAVAEKERGGKWPDAMPFVMTMNELADEIAGGDQTTRKMLYRARKTLLASRMIREVASGLMIETDISLWIGRIPDGRRKYCLSGRTSDVQSKARSSHSTVTKTRDSKVTSHSTVTDPSHSKVTDLGESVTLECSTSHSKVTDFPVAQEEAPASEDLEKTPEEKQAERASGPRIETETNHPTPVLPPDLRDIPCHPVDYSTTAVGLVADSIPANSPDFGATPPRPRTPDQIQDDRLCDWAMAQVTSARPGNDDEAIAMLGGVRYWRGAGQPCHVIAAYVAQSCGPNLGQIRRGTVAGYVTGIFKRRTADEGCPPIPAEWKPEVARPTFRGADPEAVEKQRQMEDDARRGIRPRVTKSFHQNLRDEERARLAASSNAIREFRLEIAS